MPGHQSSGRRLETEDRRPLFILQQRIFRRELFGFVFQHDGYAVANREAESIGAADELFFVLGVAQRALANGAREDVEEFGIHAAFYVFVRHLRQAPLLLHRRALPVPLQNSIDDREYPSLMLLRELDLRLHRPKPTVGKPSAFDGILLRHQDRRGVAKVQIGRLQIGMICKRVLYDVQTGGPQCLKKCLRMTDARDCVNLQLAKRLEFACCTARHGTCIHRKQAKLYARYTRWEFQFEHLLVTAIDENQIDLCQSIARLPQRTRRQHTAVAQSTRTIDHDDLAVTKQSIVLQSIVAQNHIRSPRDRLFRCAHAIRVRNDERRCLLRHEHGFVAHIAWIAVCSHFSRPSFGIAAITARHDSNTVAASGKHIGKPNHERSLARAAYRYVADHDDRFRDPTCSQTACCIRSAPCSHDETE